MTRPARTRRLALTLALVTLVALLALAVARSLPTPSLSISATATVRPTARPTAQTYALYMFSLQLDTSGSVRPGQTLLLTWQPQLDTNRRVYGPAPVNCTVALFGPFKRPDIAQQVAVALNNGGSPFVTPGAEATTIPLALEGPSLTLDGRSNTQQSSALTLPNVFAPGYYLLDARAIGIDGSSSSDETLLVESASA